MTDIGEYLSIPEAPGALLDDQREAIRRGADRLRKQADASLHYFQSVDDELTELRAQVAEKEAHLAVVAGEFWDANLAASHLEQQVQEADLRAKIAAAKPAEPVTRRRCGALAEGGHGATYECTYPPQHNGRHSWNNDPMAEPGYTQVTDFDFSEVGGSQK